MLLGIGREQHDQQQSKADANRRRFHVASHPMTMWITVKDS